MSDEITYPYPNFNSTATFSFLRIAMFNFFTRADVNFKLFIFQPVTTIDNEAHSYNITSV